MFTLVRSFCLVALVAAFAVPGFAVTYVVPTDAELIQQSDDIVVVTGLASTVERNARGGIVTRYMLRIEEVLKGSRRVGSHLVVTERGGVLGGRATFIPGTPEYAPGGRYLVFTGTDRNMEATTWGMGLGQFHLIEDRGRMLAVRFEIHGFDARNLDVHAERARDVQDFKTFIRAIVSQKPANAEYFVADAAERQIAVEWKIAANFTKNSYLMQSGGVGFRWQTPTATFVRSNLADHPGPSDGSAAVSQAFSEWNGTASAINYSDGGVDDLAVAGLEDPDGTNAILFGDPNGEVGGAAGIGGISEAFGPQDIDGEQSFKISEVDVVIKNGTIAQNCLNSVMTHEVGHTLGFRHSDTPPAGGESSDNAIMKSVVSCSWNGVLKTYDNTAAETVYGSGPVCNAPTITAQPQNKSTPVGVQTTLSVTATGTGLTYQWYFGASPDTTNPVTGGTSSSLNVTPTSVGVGEYWVQVGQSCSSTKANSNTVTVTSTCTNPAITAQSGNVTITEGNSTQLSVTAVGSNLVYQWYEGAVGDTSQPRGGNSNKLTVSPATTTNYWVNVSGACGSPVQSAQFVVTVVPCADITIDPPTATQLPGLGNFSISVNATSTSTPLSYTWFRGGTPGFGGTSLGPGQTKTVNVTAATNFWARVQNGCGRVDFSTLIVLAPCTLPTITTQPTDQTINSGQTASLSIVVSAGATVKWYRGLVGDKTNEVGAAADVTVGPLTATTQFWAEVTNDCGAISSNQVTVTVRELAELVPMLNGRFFIQVRYINQFDNGAQGKLLGRSLFSTALSETAVFTFGDANVVELMVRVSDARPFDDHIHVFLGGLSDVEFFVVVTDSLTGIVHEYHKPANQLIGALDRSTFPASNGLGSGVDALMARTAALHVTPNAESSTILLLNDRFEVRMRYRNQFTNPPGEGYMNARSIASSPTTETAVFFFDENVGSAEWMVRFSDARPFADRIDLFHGGLSDVEFTIEVHDTQTGLRKEYHKPPFSLLGLVDRESYQP